MSGNTSCQGSTLVVPAFQTLPPVQRYRNDHVGVNVAELHTSVFTPESSHGLSQPLAAQSLHSKDHVSEESLVGTKAQDAIKMEHLSTAGSAAVRKMDEWSYCTGTARAGFVRVGCQEQTAAIAKRGPFLRRTPSPLPLPRAVVLRRAEHGCKRCK